MSSALFTELAWLPRPPADFRARLRALDQRARADPGLQIQRLAQYGLDGNELVALARVIKRLCSDRVDLAPLKPVRLALISNSTTDFIVPALVASAARHGILLDVIETGYGQVAQEALDPQSRLNQSKPELVLLAIDWRGLQPRCELGAPIAADKAVADALGFLEMLREGIERGCGANLIFETIARPAEPLFGNYDLRVAGTARQLSDAFNRALVNSLQGTPHLLLDIAGLAETVGLADWHDPAQWCVAKLPFAQRMVPLYAEHVGRLIAAVRGKSRRCLALDLDNTLWSGVVGDDGLAGIVIGQGSAVGEAHLDVQSTALRLRERGIVLAVSSKNEEDVARSPFLHHPDMLLRENQIAVFQANWQDKASNLKAIAETLSLGPESIVLLDDNPVEREQVRQALPEVAVPELPDDPALYTRVLLASGYFESVSFSEEDRARADYYQANATRAVALERSGDLAAFLISLDMTITFAPFDEVARDRISQLISKSNQFNLTTRRYTPVQVQTMSRDPAYFTLQVRLSDRFGDNGMICVVVCRRTPNIWDIETWLMSCRVLGRRVEEAVLQEVALHARAAGASHLRGHFIPTDRNAMVKDHYAKLGFVCEAATEAGSTWVLDLAKLPELALPMAIRRQTREVAESS